MNELPTYQCVKDSESDYPKDILTKLGVRKISALSLIFCFCISLLLLILGIRYIYLRHEFELERAFNIIQEKRLEEKILLQKNEEEKTQIKLAKIKEEYKSLELQLNTTKEQLDSKVTIIHGLEDEISRMALELSNATSELSHMKEKEAIQRETKSTPLFSFWDGHSAASDLIPFTSFTLCLSYVLIFLLQ